ncbi:MAG TPA: methanogenesis marker 2 protein [Candidatus Methanomethylophilaceae archaeon]|nr:methanogenesis marker 2 protein [Candidatus Methanomethylophilaceae archaeon]
MSLEELVHTIRTFPGVTRKNPIHEVVNLLPLVEFPQVFASEGEDAAAVEYGDRYLLLAADGIMSSLVKSEPFYAGYFAVLVNINDIAAMGGTPIAMVDVISINNSKVCTHMLRGVEQAVRKFGVPVVGGHTHPDGDINSIEISIVGSVPKDDIILSTTAVAGDDIVFIADLDGFYPKNLPFAWDTTTLKTAESVQKQMAMLPKVASEHIVNAGKDMSNPGNIGTLGMMLESSSLGGTVDISKILRPKGVDLIPWCLSYQGFGFVFSCPPENSARLIELFESVGASGSIVGSVDDSMELKLIMDGETRTVFDFDKDIITGCRPKEKK